jgi:hypothetical protein
LPLHTVVEVGEAFTGGNELIVTVRVTEEVQLELAPVTEYTIVPGALALTATNEDVEMTGCQL